jgi:hypothetical protein
VLRRTAVVLAALAIATTFPASAPAHAPTTGIGRAVLAFEAVPVSYDPASPLTELDAEVPLRAGAGDRLHVALMPASALEEVSGGPDAVAGEIAREARLRGTLVVLAGSRFGAWSDEIGEGRLAALVSRSTSGERAPVVELRDLMSAIRAEPKNEDVPWIWIVVPGTATVLVGLWLAARQKTRTSR